MSNLLKLITKNLIATILGIFLALISKVIIDQIINFTPLLSKLIPCGMALEKLSIPDPFNKKEVLHCIPYFSGISFGVVLVLLFIMWYVLIRKVLGDLFNG